MLEIDKEFLIRERAYAIWEASGRPIGQDQEHWYQAAKEVTDETEAANPVKRVRRTLRSAGATAVRRKK